MPDHSSHTDIRRDGLIAHLAEPWQSYALLARLDRPVGSWLLFLPGVFGIFLPAEGASLKIRFFYTALFAIGSIAMRSAGCVVNDIWDRDIDRHVSRTAGRPLASGALTLRQAFSLLACLLLIGLAVLLALPPICWALAPIALLLVALYPAAKRVTWWPQLVMGFTFGFGAPMGYVASHGTFDSRGWALYIGVVIWQLGFDTIYGFQDMEDDARIGVKSTSQRMLTIAKPFICGCYILTLILFGWSASTASLSPYFWIGFAPAALWMLYQGITLTPYDAPACLKDFRQNIPIGILLAIGFIMGRLI
ncbi:MULTISPECIES: 4-hydroxybenzoate octaprenyltransferase [unclassified Saccharibacter]|uniref:4-hydroxybenzoate octaprenyltransferase n=1 Tax=unclassified Saccharibacter TaxID=2648722 RepID=UPI00132C4CB7|nr:MULTISPECIES: 4-hydroxybenzoate octaprenyltransferase [unclassified Saccharibacter]MXV35367.1 4-hydroxybenzoate polyprenyltransferase [Saccharibacter sp. EH611]MXV57785.1 4-hydroxybenzoate polyprenyltransferase [Saccharibacter sp. EH70]MXV65301.1 4-hydroxybenzoate polyprenyltransferase [Saccharibacter sp. EH60]